MKAEWDACKVWRMVGSMDAAASQKAVQKGFAGHPCLLFSKDREAWEWSRKEKYGL